MINNTMNILFKNLRSHLPFLVLFISLLVVGFTIYDDYGISWDEPISRENNGIINYDFIRTGDYKQLITGLEKYHGPAFEILLVNIEHVCGLHDTKDIFLMRHLVTFLIFVLSVFIFYLLFCV